MTPTLLFFVSLAALPVFGAPAAFSSVLRHASLAARLAAAWAAGAAALTVTTIAWTILGVPLTAVGVGLPLTVAAVVGSVVLFRRGDCAQPPAAGEQAGGPLRTASGVAVSLAAVHLAVGCITGFAAAADLPFFWGVKALAAAESGTLAPSTLAGPFAVHTHPSYPPLYPATLLWGVLVSGDLPWRAVPLVSVVWLLAAAALVRWLLNRAVGLAHATAVTTFWTVAMSIVLVQATSAGNAEPPLVLYGSVAVAALLAETSGASGVRLVAGLALAGAVLTKSEGVVWTVLVVLGTVLRDLLASDSRWRSRLVPLVTPPSAAWSLWLVARVLRDLPLTDPIRERAFAIGLDHVGAILSAAAANLHGGTRGLVWLVPLVALVAVRARLRPLLPALAVTIGLFGFLFVYYLHARGDPAQLVGWTVARVTLGGLSALILAAGVATAPHLSAETAAQSTSRRG